MDGVKIKGGYFRDLRDSYGYSLQYVADYVGVTRNYISEIERDIKQPSDEVLKKLCDFYKQDEKFIFNMYNKVPISVTNILKENTDIVNLLYAIQTNKNINKEDRNNIMHGIIKEITAHINK